MLPRLPRLTVVAIVARNVSHPETILDQSMNSHADQKRNHEGNCVKFHG